MLGHGSVGVLPSLTLTVCLCGHFLLKCTQRYFSTCIYKSEEMRVGVPVGSVKGKNKLIVSRLKNAASVPH